jgi:hypothetical protein
VPTEKRLRVEGIADALVWGSSALAAAASGFVLSEVGYETLSHGAALLALAPALFLAGAGRSRG